MNRTALYKEIDNEKRRSSNSIYFSLILIT